MNSASLQLMQARSQLAPWIYRRDMVIGRLPVPLAFGPVEYLQNVLALTESPHVSARLRDDALILLTYGASSFLPDRFDDNRGCPRLDAQRETRESQRSLWRRQAIAIQRSWRVQRFVSRGRPPLKLDTSAFLIPEMQTMMAQKEKQHAALEKQDSLDDLVNVRVEVNENELQHQVATYAAELHERLVAKRKEEEEIERRARREQRVQEERRKRMVRITSV
ncbi:hypothetical protein PINS_up007373 [Pythium insidiosum]|nr:hypothetical protein PINS_up007373 [Pythium insidiosum]